MVSTKALGSDIEYSLRSNALSAKSILGGRVALTHIMFIPYNKPVLSDHEIPGLSFKPDLVVMLLKCAREAYGLKRVIDQKSRNS